jgi:hypothetical protein
MAEWLAKVEFGEVIGFVAVVGGLLCGMVAIIGHFWYELRRTEAESALKQEMLARGMSAEDIRTVLEASSASHVKASCGRSVCRG